MRAFLNDNFWLASVVCWGILIAMLVARGNLEERLPHPRNKIDRQVISTMSQAVWVAVLLLVGVFTAWVSSL